MRKLARAVVFIFVITTLIAVMVGCSNIQPEWDYTWEDNGDMEIIRQRMVNDLYDVNADPSIYLSDIGEDGSFQSIEYDTDMQDTWHPAKHLDYVRIMQVAYNTEGNSYYNNGDLLDKINKTLRYWVDKDYYCDWNGWWNGLGIGPKIADILLFPNNGIDKGILNALTNKLSTVSCLNETRKASVKEREIDSTGGNLTDKVNHTLIYTVITRDGSSIKYLRRLMENELRPFPSVKWPGNRWDAEGIKADMSFQQHFELLYIGGYGEVFADGMNKFIRYTSGTQFALSDKALNFYQDFLLDGMQYAMRGKYRDINASGRGIVRKGELVGIRSQVIEGCYTLLNSGARISRADELISLINNRSEETDLGAGGHKYFWNSDYQVYNDTAYMASVRHASNRTKNSEALNGENIWGHYLGAGATMFYNTGDEYFDIAPIYNWNKVSGTTAVQGALPLGGGETYSRKGRTSFVGGVSTGKIGMSCMDYRDSGVKAKKAWFMFEEGVVCLGSDISSSKKGELFTTINQTLQRGETMYSVNGNVINNEQISYEGAIDWAFNNGIGYITDSNVQIEAALRAGDWKYVSNRVSSSIHRDSVFEIGISHGNKPSNIKYDYTVLMNTTPQATQQYSINPTIITLSNSDRCQAVWNTNSQTMMAVFWKKGDITLPSGEKLSVSDGCTLVCQKTDTGYKIYVNDPEQNGGKLTVQVGDRQTKFSFEKGMYAGKTYYADILA